MKSIYKPYNFLFQSERVVLTAICQVPDEKKVICKETQNEEFLLKPFTVKLVCSLPEDYPSKSCPVIEGIGAAFCSEDKAQQIREDL